MHLNPLSLAPLFLETLVTHRDGSGGADSFETASGFLVGTPEDPVLVTALHVLTGEDPAGRYEARPDVLRVHFPVDGTAGPAREPRDVPLYLEPETWDRPVWAGHTRGREVDVAVLRVGPLPAGARDAFLDPDAPPLTMASFWGPGNGPLPEGADVAVPMRVTDRLFVVGWPYGDQGTWPTAVWSTGFVATEPEVPWKDRPAFLLDSRTRPGQSGAPVLRHLTPDTGVRLADGTALLHDMTVTVLVGVYTGRLDERSDLGMVYTCDAVLDALARLPA